jgi:hypothetical protein
MAVRYGEESIQCDYCTARCGTVRTVPTVNVRCGAMRDGADAEQYGTATVQNGAVTPSRYVAGRYGHGTVRCGTVTMRYGHGTVGCGAATVRCGTVLSAYGTVKFG